MVCLSPNGCAVIKESAPARELLIGTIRGLVHFHRDEIGQPWREVRRSLEHVHVSCVLREHTTGRLFVGGHGQNGLWMSDDDGETWRESMNDIAERHIFHISQQHMDGHPVLHVGVEPPALYRSDDLGETWQVMPALTEVPGQDRWTFPPPPHFAHAKNVAWSPAEPETIYVCVEQGALLKSTDAGKSFTELSSYESVNDMWYHDVHRVVIRDRDHRQMFLAGGEGIHYTEDGGDTWKQLQTRHDRIGYPDALVVDPHNEDTVFVAGAGNNPKTWADQEISSSDAAVLRSDDGGQTWREAMNGLPSPLRGNIEAMSMHSHADGIELFIGTATGEAYTSVDRGDSWTEVASGLPPVSKVHHYRWFLAPEEKTRIEELARQGH